MLALATTTIRVEDPGDGDPYETADTTVLSTGTAAHIGQPSGSEIDRGGEFERITDVLLTDSLIDLTHRHHVVDETTGQRYRVSWVRQRQGLGLDHTAAGLVSWQGGANG